MKYPKRSQYEYAKSQYRVRNWPEYEASLQRRGDLTVWLTDEALYSWRAPASGKPGGQRTYANIAIEAALTIRMVFNLPLRQTEGFLRCLAELLQSDLTCGWRKPRLPEIIDIWPLRWSLGSMGKWVRMPPGLAVEVARRDHTFVTSSVPLLKEGLDLSVT